jgi:hypothetical protein
VPDWAEYLARLSGRVETPTEAILRASDALPFHINGKGHQTEIQP